MNKIVIILGTRPEAIKLIPVYLACKKIKEQETILVSTGQHREMLDQIFNFFRITADVDLGVMTENQSLGKLTSSLFTKIDELVNDLKPKILVVQGDTSTAMVASMVGYYYKIKVAHVEAGLRTGDKYSPFPEEINRRIIGLTADVHFTPTATATDMLRKENVKNIYEVGNTVIDSLLLCKKIVEKQKDKYYSKFSKWIDFNKKIVLITGHRRESFGEAFQSICHAVTKLSTKYKEFQFIYPVHLNPNVRDTVFSSLSDKKNIFLWDPLPYDELVFIMSRSYIILTDSGGIQEEAPSLKVPLIVLRETTERPEGIKAGCSTLAGTNTLDIVNAFDKIHTDRDLYNNMKNVTNPYGDGLSSSRIAEILQK